MTVLGWDRPPGANEDLENIHQENIHRCDTSIHVYESLGAFRWIQFYEKGK